MLSYIDDFYVDGFDSITHCAVGFGGTFGHLLVHKRR